MHAGHVALSLHRASALDGAPVSALASILPCDHAPICGSVHVRDRATPKREKSTPRVWCSQSGPTPHSARTSSHAARSSMRPHSWCRFVRQPQFRSKYVLKNVSDCGVSELYLVARVLTVDWEAGRIIGRSAATRTCSAIQSVCKRRARRRGCSARSESH